MKDYGFLKCVSSRFLRIYPPPLSIFGEMHAEVFSLYLLGNILAIDPIINLQKSTYKNTHYLHFIGRSIFMCRDFQLGLSYKSVLSTFYYWNRKQDACQFLLPSVSSTISGGSTFKGSIFPATCQCRYAQARAG